MGGGVGVVTLPRRRRCQAPWAHRQPVCGVCGGWWELPAAAAERCVGGTERPHLHFVKLSAPGLWNHRLQQKWALVCRAWRGVGSGESEGLGLSHHHNTAVCVCVCTRTVIEHEGIARKKSPYRCEYTVVAFFAL